MRKVTKAALRRLLEGYVSEGVAKLDQYFAANRPGSWRSSIDLRKLDVTSIYQCPLAQVFGGYGYGMDTLGLRNTGGSTMYGSAHLYGFDLPDRSEVIEALGIDTEDGPVQFPDPYWTFVVDEVNRLWRKAVRAGRPASNAATR